MLSVTPNATEFHNVGAGAGTANIRMANEIMALAQCELLYKILGTRATEAQMNTDITEINLKVGGTVQRAITPARVFSLEKLKGQTVTDGRIPLRFTQPERRTIYGEDKTALFPHLVPEISLDVSLAAQVSARTLEARLVGHKLTQRQYEAIREQPSVVTYTEQQVQVTSTGKKVHDYTQSQGRAISMIHAFSADITALKVLVGDLVLFDFTDKDMLDALLEDAGFVPQANIWSFGGELLTGRIDDALLASGRTIHLEFTMGAATSFDILVEELGSLKK